eukprot:TRINITY_DN4322_c0_g1_i1.p1 TRINITY_DN4322_c0_g1~~TRINITY_DN4322_c0_g1_i1.p1  ORF type:complete len:260 (-),score=57.55 TRINITY_DN4322_c0_g1_i1:57-836(-)
MGGHAYSSYNNIQQKINDYAVYTTGGGDNIVLAQQAAKYLLGEFKLSKKANFQSILGDVAYFADQKNYGGFNPHELTKGRSFKDVTLQLDMLKWLSIRTMLNLESKLNTNQKKQAWDENQMDIIEATEVYYYYNVLRIFSDCVQTAENSIKPLLTDLVQLFGLTALSKLIKEFLIAGFISGEQAATIKQEHLSVCKKVRASSETFVDAFNYPDWYLKAPLGIRDGNMYEAYFDVINNVPDARTTPFWNDLVLPLLKSNL